MALYDGFFDAMLDEETGKYDREYDSSDFTGYFGEIIGSGVCIYENPDSFKVRIENTSAVISPGYLFIRGYWLRNDEDYTVVLPDSGVYAIVAHLNLGARIIEILVQEKAAVESDSLVLGYVTVGFGGTPTVEDTRYNTDICGVIDSIGSLSGKVEFAINYIDNEVEKRLEDAEKAVSQETARLDAKIAEVAALVEKLAPLPIGTIKFSAANSVGAEWLACDGSFIREADYPELVQALGKRMPASTEFKNPVAFYPWPKGIYTNGVFYGGFTWTFCLTNKTLYGYNESAKKGYSIKPLGTEKLSASAANLAWLSISNGHIYLVQDYSSVNTFLLLESEFNDEAINGSGAVISRFTELDAKSVLQSYNSSYGNVQLPGDNFIPEVVSTQYDFGSETLEKAQALCLGRKYIYWSTSNRYIWLLLALIWKDSDFSTARVKEIFVSSTLTDRAGNDYTGPYVNTLFRYSRKNSSEILFLDVIRNITDFFDVKTHSLQNGTYTTSTDARASSYWSSGEPIKTSPVAANGRYIYRCRIENKKLLVNAGEYSPNRPYEGTVTTAPTLPARAAVFPDSVCYVADQDLWFVFVGTGIAFSPTPSDGASWGYLDTQSVLGIVTQSGGVEYDSENRWLYIFGVGSDGLPKMGVMQMPDVYDYSDDGTWLPSINSHGVPAYIKAYEPEDGV